MITCVPPGMEWPFGGHDDHRHAGVASSPATLGSSQLVYEHQPSRSARAGTAERGGWWRSQENGPGGIMPGQGGFRWIPGGAPSGAPTTWERGQACGSLLVEAWSPLPGTPRGMGSGRQQAEPAWALPWQTYLLPAQRGHVGLRRARQVRVRLRQERSGPSTVWRTIRTPAHPTRRGRPPHPARPAGPLTLTCPYRSSAGTCFLLRRAGKPFPPPLRAGDDHARAERVTCRHSYDDGAGVADRHDVLHPELAAERPACPLAATSAPVTCEGGISVSNAVSLEYVMDTASAGPLAPGRPG
jgi:hypothetical protein